MLFLLPLFFLLLLLLLFLLPPPPPPRWEPSARGSEAGKGDLLSPRHLGGLGGSQLGLESLMAEIHERREECDRLTGVLELQKQHFKQELEYLGGQLREESIRCDRCSVHC